MIHDVDRTLQKMIYERGRLNRTEIDISFEQPTSQWAAGLNRPTINCWLYDLRENTKLRSMEMVIEKDRGSNRAKRRIVPLRFNLSYFITAWTRKIEDEHQLLWRALAAIARTTSLDPEQCEGALRGQPFEIPVQVGQMEETGISTTDLWSVLGNEMRPGFNAMFTLALDTETEFDLPLVLEGVIGIGQSEEPPSEQLTERDDFQVRLPGRRGKKAEEGQP